MYIMEPFDAAKRPEAAAAQPPSNSASVAAIVSVAR
jgi:hypothetical protein